MIKNIILIVFFSLASTIGLRGQNINFDDYDIFLSDTLICKADFVKNGKSIDSLRLKYLTFKPIADGDKKIYYLNGQLYGQGQIKNKKENGLWVYWHENGQKAREGHFEEGIKTGIHTYWYKSGNLRGVGSFKNDKYEGKWTMYKEDNSESIVQFYKNGELVKQK